MWHLEIWNRAEPVTVASRHSHCGRSTGSVKTGRSCRGPRPQIEMRIWNINIVARCDKERVACLTPSTLECSRDFGIWKCCEWLQPSTTPNPTVGHELSDLWWHSFGGLMLHSRIMENWLNMSFNLVCFFLQCGHLVLPWVLLQAWWDRAPTAQASPCGWVGARIFQLSCAHGSGERGVSSYHFTIISWPKFSSLSIPPRQVKEFVALPATTFLAARQLSDILKPWWLQLRLPGSRARNCEGCRKRRLKYAQLAIANRIYFVKKQATEFYAELRLLCLNQIKHIPNCPILVKCVKVRASRTNVVLEFQDAHDRSHWVAMPISRVCYKISHSWQEKNTIFELLFWKKPGDTGVGHGWMGRRGKSQPLPIHSVEPTPDCPSAV